jgi:hypothetical protein
MDNLSDLWPENEQEQMARRMVDAACAPPVPWRERFLEFVILPVWIVFLVIFPGWHDNAGEE